MCTISRLLLLSTLALFSSALLANDSDQAGSGGMPPPKVGVLTLEEQAVTVHAVYPGRVRANREVEVRAQVGGILLERNYTEGAVVEKDQVLFRIDPRPYQAKVNQAEADLHNAHAQQSKAERDWDRISSLYERQVASEQDRDNAKSALEVAKAQVEVADAQLEAVKIDLEYSTVRAPIEGIAGLRIESTGNLVNPGDLLTRVTEIDPIQVQFTYAANDPYASSEALQAGPGREADAEIIFPDGKSLTGRLDFTDVAIDAQTDTIRARAMFPNPDGDLRANQFVRLRIAVEKRENAIVIPETALASGPEPESRIVWKLSEDDTAHQQPVETGPLTARGRIIDSGLSAGDRIVVRGIVKLHDGIQVRVGSDDASDAPADAATGADGTQSDAQAGGNGS
ncbi:MAG: efflux RND transporter periplasmic adaptor subunit [Halothiobacillaceae bacterium]